MPAATATGTGGYSTLAKAVIITALLAGFCAGLALLIIYVVLPANAAAKASREAAAKAEESDAVANAVAKAESDAAEATASRQAAAKAEGDAAANAAAKEESDAAAEEAAKAESDAAAEEAAREAAAKEESDALAERKRPSSHIVSFKPTATENQIKLVENDLLDKGGYITERFTLIRGFAAYIPPGYLQTISNNKAVENITVNSVISIGRPPSRFGAGTINERGYRTWPG